MVRYIVHMKSFYFFADASKRGIKFLIPFCMLLGIGLHAYATSQDLSVKPSVMDQKFMLAIEENDCRTIAAFIQDGQNVNSQNFFGYTPLHYASKKGSKKVVALLIQSHALLDQVSAKNGNTPLLLAVREGYKDIVSLLLAAGANVEIVNHKGYNALHLAIQHHREDLVALLLQAGASSCTYTREGYSCLSAAIRVGSLPIVQLLLQQKEVSQSQDHQGYTELHWAVKQNAVDTFRRLLLSRRFNINAKAKNNATSLHLAAANQKINPRLLKCLFKVPLLEVNVQDITGNTPLHYAVVKNQLGVVCSLLEYGSVDVNIQNQVGQTALHYAVQNNNMVIVKKLLAYTGIDVTLKNKKDLTPIELAMAYKHFKISKLLWAYKDLIGID